MNNKRWLTQRLRRQARRLVTNGLASGTTYKLGVRAIGGSTGYSGWSATVSITVGP